MKKWRLSVGERRVRSLWPAAPALVGKVNCQSMGFEAEAGYGEEVEGEGGREEEGEGREVPASILPV